MTPTVLALYALGLVMVAAATWAAAKTRSWWAPTLVVIAFLGLAFEIGLIK